MSIKIVVCSDFDAISEQAAGFVSGRISAGRSGEGSGFVMGLATGNSPTGMYKHLAKAANAGVFDPSRVRSFNLDEYVGLPGCNPQERATHPESYSYFMIQEFFGLLARKFASARVPAGTIIDQAILDQNLELCHREWREVGSGKGRAIVISESAEGYLGWIRDNVLHDYDRQISAAGGIDLQVIGVGGKGHVAFHEAGIGFEGSRMLLVRLDDNTVANAVRDGHFASADDCPHFAVSMGAELVFQARTVVLLADGPRKVEPVMSALLGPVTPDVPLSFCQEYSARGGELVCFVDAVVGAGILEQRDMLLERGWQVIDRSSESAIVPVRDIRFSRDPVTGRFC